MRLSVEVYVLSEFAVSAALLALTTRLVGTVKPARVLLAALLSAVASAAIQARGRGGVLPLALPPASVFLALGWSGRHDWLRGTGWCLLLSAAFAGCATLFQNCLPLRGMARAPLLMAPFFLVIRRLKRDSFVPEPTVRLRVMTDAGEAEFTALVDTGNQLREPFSGQPVLIASADSLSGALDAALIRFGEDAPLPPGFRIVCYRALGGGGRLHCFRPKSVKCLVRGQWVNAPALWIGLYRGPLPGGASALAPACCAAEAFAGKRAWGGDTG